MKKQIDVIIPAYNAHNTIDKAVASLVAQTVSECIRVTIVNDGSEKDYSETIKKFGGLIEIREIILSTNGGCGHARQVGLDNATYPYIMFMDADDLLYSPLSVACLYMGFQNNKDLRVVYGGIDEISLENHLIKHIHPNHWTWIFGCMYSKKFLDEFNIRFYNNSAGEDVGFNKIIKMICQTCQETVLFIPDTIYLWTDSNKENRINTEKFIYDTSKPGYITNMIYAHNEAKKNLVPIEVLVNDAIVSMCSLYFQFLELIHFNEDHIGNYLEHARKFYHEVYKLYIPFITKQEVTQIYNENLNYCSNKGKMFEVDEITFAEFVRMISQ